MGIFDENKLSTHQLERLLEAVESGGHGVAHNFRAHLRLLSSLFHLFKKMDKSEELPSDWLGVKRNENGDFVVPEKTIDWMLDQIVRANRIVDMTIGTYREKDLSVGDRFVVDVHAIVTELKEIYSEANIAIRNTGGVQLLLVYPISSFFTILQELVVNAIKHSKLPVKLHISWAMNHRYFVLDVEDDGQGIRKNLSGTFVSHYDVGSNNGYGLSGIRDIVYASKGSLLFRKSPALGGTHVRIKIPMVAAWIDGAFHNFGES